MKNLISENVHPDITFRPSGLITLSSRIVRTLDIREGDVINIAQDKGESLLYVQHRSPLGKFSGRCLRHKKKSHYMRIYFKKLTDIIISLCGQAEAHYRVGEAIKMGGTTYLPIITKLNLYKGNEETII